MITKLDIDWDWVKVRVNKAERIHDLDQAGSKRVLLSCMEECLEKAKALAEPRFISIEKRIAGFKENGIELQDGTILSGRSLLSYLNGARGVSIFLVTIGSELEETASRLMREGEHLNGYLLDRTGSFAVECLAEEFENKTRQDREGRNESVSMRYSPGYCDWPIEEQFILAKILDFSKIGVSLTKGCMMVPKKSISAMVGIGPKGLFATKISQCAICDKKESCDYRRIY